MFLTYASHLKNTCLQGFRVVHLFVAWYPPWLFFNMFATPKPLISRQKALSLARTRDSLANAQLNAITG